MTNDGHACDPLHCCACQRCAQLGKPGDRRCIRCGKPDSADPYNICAACDAVLDERAKDVISVQTIILEGGRL